MSRQGHGEEQEGDIETKWCNMFQRTVEPGRSTGINAVLKPEPEVCNPAATMSVAAEQISRYRECDQQSGWPHPVDCADGAEHLTQEAQRAGVDSFEPSKIRSSSPPLDGSHSLVSTSAKRKACTSRASYEKTLLGLPRELRDCIYAFTSSGAFRVEGTFGHKVFTPSVLDQVNRQLQLESGLELSRSIAMSLTLVIVEWPGVKDLEHIASKLSPTRKLIIEIFETRDRLFSSWPEWEESLQNLDFGAFDKAEFVTFVFHRLANQDLPESEKSEQGLKVHLPGSRDSFQLTRLLRRKGRMSGYVNLLVKQEISGSAIYYQSTPRKLLLSHCLPSNDYDGYLVLLRDISCGLFGVWGERRPPGLLTTATVSHLRSDLPPPNHWFVRKGRT